MTMMYVMYLNDPMYTTDPTKFIIPILVTPHGDIGIGLGNGFVPDGTKPLSLPVLTYHYSVVFTCEFRKKRSPAYLLQVLGDYTIKIIPRGWMS